MKPLIHPVFRHVLYILLLCCATGCVQEPVPLQGEDQTYVGIWEQGSYADDDRYVYLQISAGGYLAYAHMIKETGSSYCMAIMQSPITIISEEQITVSLFWKFTADFIVNSPPEEINDVYTMIVDGYELVRTSTDAEKFEYTMTCDDGLARTPVSDESI